MMQERYYVQSLTEQVFIIRERASVDKGPGPGDRLVKSFDIHHDAIMYVNNANEMQRKLDEHHGHWTQSAI